MRSDWILDVLIDLQTFAEQNGMPASADQLSTACLVIAAELAETPANTDIKVDQACLHEAGLGRLSGCYSAS